MATKPLEFTSELSGQTYVWDKDTPPTDRDIAILVAADKAYHEKQIATKEEVTKGAERAAGGGSMPPSGMVPMAATQAAERLGQAATEAAPAMAEAGIATAAQAAGTALAGPAGGAAGGAAGGFVGSLVGQAMRGEELSFPKAAGAAASSAVIGGPLRGATIGKLGIEAGKQAGANVAGLALQRIMEGKDIDPAEAAMYAGMAGLSTYVGKVLDPGALADREMRRKILQFEADKYLAQAQARGIKVQPSMVNPSRLNSLVEAIAGKEMSIAEIRQLNQDLFTAMAAKDVGVTPQLGVKLSDQLELARKEAGGVYGRISELKKKADADLKALEGKTSLTAANQHELEVARSNPDYVREQAKLSRQAGADIEKFQEASNQERLYRSKYDRTRDPEDLKTANDFAEKAKAADRGLEDGLDALGKSEMYAEFQAARKRIAKIKELENILTPTQQIPPEALARSLQRGAPFSENLRTLSQIASDPRLKPVMTSEVTQLPVAAGRIQAATDVATQPLRGLLQSDVYQRFVAQPQYNLSPDALARFARMGTQAELEEKQAAPNSLLEFYKKVYPRTAPTTAIPQPTR